MILILLISVNLKFLAIEKGDYKVASHTYFKIFKNFKIAITIAAVK